MKDNLAALPSQGELLLPLLQVLEENGPMTAKEACNAVAIKMELSNEITTATGIDGDGERFNIFRRRVRWTKQSAVAAGLIPQGQLGIWELSYLGHKKLNFASPGVVICIMRSDDGFVYFAEALHGLRYIDDLSTTLIISSPAPSSFKDPTGDGSWSITTSSSWSIVLPCVRSSLVMAVWC